MYYIVLLILVVISGAEIYTGKRSTIWFNVSYFLMTFMATFRYGQMNDYFNYYFNYEHPDVYMAIDPLFGLLIMAFKALSIDYTAFIATLSLTCMLLSYRFFKIECERRCLSLLLFYAFTFINCPMNAIRQALCLAFLLYIYPLLKSKRYKLFYLCVLVGSFIHLSFVIVIVLPFFLRYHFYNKRWLIYVIAGFALLAFAGISISHLVPIDRLTYYKEGGGAGILLRMGLRILIIIPVLLFHPKEGTNGYYAKALCIMGFVMYCLFSFNDLVAGRLEYYFRTFICLFAAYIASNYERNLHKVSQLTILAVLHVFIWFKNIDAGIESMSYKEGITAFNFPYISVFDKSELKEYSGIYTGGFR